MSDGWRFKYLPGEQSNSQYEAVIERMYPLIQLKRENILLEMLAKHKFIMNKFPFYKEHKWYCHTSLLYDSLYYGCFEFANHLIPYVDVSICDKQRSIITGLLWNCETYDYNVMVSVIEKLIKKGADINAQTSDCGETPLHYSVAAGNIKMVQFLCELGANTAIKDNDRLTCFDTVLDLERYEISTYLQSLCGRLTKRAI